MAATAASPVRFAGGLPWVPVASRRRCDGVARRAQAGQRLVAAEERQDLEQRRRRRLAGDGQTRELSEIHELEAERRRLLAIERLERLRRELIELAEAFDEAIEPLSALGRKELLRRLGLVLSRSLEVKASGLDQLHQR